MNTASATLLLHRLGVIVLLLGLAGCVNWLAQAIPSFNQSVDLPELPAGRYEAARDHASIHFKVNHMGYSLMLGRFNKFDGFYTFDPEAPGRSHLEVTVDLTSIDTGVQELDERLQGSGWFDTGNYPQARFISDTLILESASQGRLEGTLTLKGVSRPVALDVIFNGGSNNFLTGRFTMGFEAHGSISRSAFGVDALPNLAGDEVMLEIHIEFERTGDFST